MRNVDYHTLEHLVCVCIPVSYYFMTLNDLLIIMVYIIKFQVSEINNQQLYKFIYLYFK
jgi:hypothetical protein